MYDVIIQKRGSKKEQRLMETNKRVKSRIMELEKDKRVKNYCVKDEWGTDATKHIMFGEMTIKKFNHFPKWVIA